MNLPIPVQQEALSDLPPELRRYALAALAPETVRVYGSAKRDFETYCESRGIVVAFPATPRLIMEYMAARVEGEDAVTPDSLSQKIAGLSFYHRIRGFEDPTQNSNVRVLMKGIKREHRKTPTQKKAFTRKELVSITRVLLSNVSSYNIRSRALLLLMVAGALRREEAANLNVEDMVIHLGATTGLKIKLNRTKNHPEGETKFIPEVNGPLNALGAVIEWQQFASIKSGPLFRHFEPDGSLSEEGLSGYSIGELIKDMAESIGLPRADYGGHTPRATHITLALEAGVEEYRVRQLSGHKSVSAFAAYDRRPELAQADSVRAVLGG